MLSISRLLVICAVLVIGANGASLATAENKHSNCTLKEHFKVFSCIMRMNNFIDKIDELDMDDSNEVKEFKKSCDGLKLCFDSIACGGEPEKEMSKFLDNYCTAVVYFSEDFADCSEKLEKKNGECFESWDPFPGIDDNGNKVKKIDEGEACKNIFGKNNCMKEEITVVCGEAQWLDFKKNFATFGKIANGCDLNHV